MFLILLERSQGGVAFGRTPRALFFFNKQNGTFCPQPDTQELGFGKFHILRWTCLLRSRKTLCSKTVQNVSNHFVLPAQINLCSYFRFDSLDVSL